MKYPFLLGGFAGFSLAFLVGCWSQRSPLRLFADASLACLLTAFTFRWAWSILAGSFQHLVKDRKTALSGLNHTGTQQPSD